MIIKEVNSGIAKTLEDETSKKMEILNELIEEHNNGECNCDLTDWGTGLCLAGAYIGGCRDLQDTLEDICID